MMFTGLVPSRREPASLQTVGVVVIRISYPGE